MGQSAIAGEVKDQRTEAEPHAPTPGSRPDSFRAPQGQSVAAAGQQDQSTADALTPRRRLDSFRQQQAKAGMQQTPSTPDAVKLDIGPVAEESKAEAHRPTRPRSIDSITEVRHGHRMPAAHQRDSDWQPLPGRHTCSLPPWCEA